MFDDYNSGKLIFKLYGVKEDQLLLVKEQINNLTEGGVDLSFWSKEEDFTVELLKKSDNNATFDKAVKIFINTFSDFIYANQEVDLATHAINLLKLGGYILQTAESFTGGGVANALVKVEGASEVFYEGIVCYNTQSKIDRLGVKPLTVKNHTVVSREVAFEMVKGLIEGGKCNVAVATTGYASQTEDGKGGLCFIAVANESRAEVFRYKLSGTREQIMAKGKDLALFALIKLLRG